MEGNSKAGHKYCHHGELYHGGKNGNLAMLVMVNTKGVSRASASHLVGAVLSDFLNSDGPWDLHSGVGVVSSLCFFWLNVISYHIHNSPVRGSLCQYCCY